MKWKTIFIVLALGLNSGAACAQNWSVETKTSPIDGKITTIATDGGLKSAVLIVRCQAHCEMYVIPGRGIVSKQTSVRIRLDGGQPERVLVQRSDDATGLFFQNPMPLLEKIRHANRLVIEYSPYEEIPATVTFEVAGLPGAITFRLDKAKQSAERAAEQRTRQKEECRKLAADPSSTLPEYCTEERQAREDKAALATQAQLNEETGVIQLRVKMSQDMISDTAQKNYYNMCVRTNDQKCLSLFPREVIEKINSLNLIDKGKLSRCLVTAVQGGADIYVDGARAGVTPLVIMLEKRDVARVIAIKKEGYRDVERHVDPDGKDTTISVTLEKN